MSSVSQTQPSTFVTLVNLNRYYITLKGGTWIPLTKSYTHVQNSSLADIFLPTNTAVAFPAADRAADMFPNTVWLNRVLLTREELLVALVGSDDWGSRSPVSTTQFTVFHSLSQVLHGSTARKDMYRKYNVQATITL